MLTLIYEPPQIGVKSWLAYVRTHFITILFDRTLYYMLLH
jgi:hypothetical protein